MAVINDPKDSMGWFSLWSSVLLNPQTGAQNSRIWSLNDWKSEFKEAVGCAEVARRWWPALGTIPWP